MADPEELAKLREFVEKMVEKAKRSIPDHEVKLTTNTLFAKISSEFKATGTVKPRLFCALHQSTDEQDMKELLQRTAQELEGEHASAMGKGNMMMRAISEVAVDLPHNRMDKMEQLGHAMSLEEEIVAIFIATQMWQSQECQKLGCTPEEAPDRALCLGIMGMTVDGRCVFEGATVDADKRTVGESAYHDDFQSPLLEAWWRGYTLGWGEKLGIVKSDEDEDESDEGWPTEEQ